MMKESDMTMNNYLPTDYQSFIHKSRYAKYFDGKGRESWSDTVERYMDNVVRPKLGDDTYVNSIRDAILNLEVMPSMRAMMTAGPALERDNTAGYNCSYLPVDDPKSFDEAMFILLCGTGVGFSVERQYISKLPEVPTLFQSDTTIVVKDSKEGWAKAFRQLLARRLDNCWHSSGLVRSLNGMSLRYVLQVQDLKHLAVEPVAQRL
jgi:ribonucleoside-diphosphate reductase alpha chain